MMSAYHVGNFDKHYYEIYALDARLRACRCWRREVQAGVSA